MSQEKVDIGDSDQPVAQDRLRTSLQLLLCVVSGTLIFLSFPFTTQPDSNIWPLAWFGFVPLLWALEGSSPKRGFWLGAVTGLVTNFGGFWWINGVLADFGHLPGFVSWPLTGLNALYQGLIFAFFAYFLRRLERRAQVSIFVAAALFTLIEYVYPLIFPWYLGNGQYRFLEVIQIAELTGVMGITFVMVSFSVALHRLAHWRFRGGPKPGRGVVIALVITLVTVGYGAIRLGQVRSDIDDAETLKIGLVEADVGIWEKQAKHLPRRERALTLHRNLLTHQRMSQGLEAAGVDLVLWPESSFFPLGDTFIKRRDAFALGLASDGHLWRWQPVESGTFDWIPAPASLADGVTWTAVDAAREDAWVAAGEGGKLLLSDVQGRRMVPNTSRANLRTVQVVERVGFLSGQDAAPVAIWAAGDGGVLLSGTDSGVEVVATATESTIRALAMRSGRSGIAVGDGGLILAIDGGRAATVKTTTTEDLLDVWLAPDGKRGVAVGRQGRVLVSNAGGDFVAEQSPTEADLHAVAVDLDANTWVGGGGGFVARRGAGGWTQHVIEGAGSIVALEVEPRGALIAADEHAKSWVLSEPDSADLSRASWQPQTQTPGLRALTPLHYVRAHPIPRNVRYIYQSRASLPEIADFNDHPEGEFQLASRERTAVQRGFRTPIIFGGLTWVPPPAGSETTRDKQFNTAIMLDETGRVVGAYDKVYLLVFGEYIPFGDTFPGLHDLIPEAGRFSAGDEVRVFEWGKHRIGVMICYEDILPKFTSRLADERPNIIINVTNDAWFGATSEPYLHLALSIFRAVENRLTLIRSTNTGVSAFVDPTGAIIGETGLADPETLVRTVPMMSGATVYGRLGDTFTYLVAIGFAGFLWVRRRRRRAMAPPQSET